MPLVDLPFPLGIGKEKLLTRRDGQADCAGEDLCGNSILALDIFQCRLFAESGAKTVTCGLVECLDPGSYLEEPQRRFGAYYRLTSLNAHLTVIISEHRPKIDQGGQGLQGSSYPERQISREAIHQYSIEDAFHC